MFIGHFALGFASGRTRNSISLGTSFLAVQFLDLLWPFFLIFGWEVVEVDPVPLDSICEQHEKLFEKHFPNKPYFGIDSEPQ